WGYFVPHHLQWRVAVWIEIDRFRVENYRSPSSLLQQWKDEERWSQRLMPGIEAGCLGDLPLAAFRSAFLTWNDGNEVRDLDLTRRSAVCLAIEEWRSQAGDK